MDGVRKLILEKLAEMQLDRKKVSEALGRNDTYLHQFLHRGTPVELKERDRIKLAKLLGVPETELRGPSTRDNPKQNLDKMQNLVATKIPHPYQSAERDNEEQRATVLFSGPELPVYGATQNAGQIGVFMLSQRAVDWTSRPGSLARVEDAYGIIINDPFAPPRLPIGSTALVHPHLPPSIGDACIFRCYKEDGTTIVQAREFCGETETHWKVRQHHPTKDTTLKKAEWACHKTVGAHF